MKKLHILAVEDQLMFLKGFVDTISVFTAVESVTASSTYDDAISKVMQRQYDIAFLDLNLKNSRHNGFELCKEIKGRYKNTLVAILSQYDASSFAKQAHEAGADVFFSKNTDPEVYEAFINNWANGISPAVYVNGAIILGKADDMFFDAFELQQRLTGQEFEVMKMRLSGKSPEDISAALNCGMPNYYAHRANVLKKLHVKDDVELMLLAVRNGWVRGEGMRG